MASRFFGPSVEEAFRTKPIAKNAMTLIHPSDDRRHYPCNPDLFSSFSSLGYEDTRHMSDKERARQIKVYGAKV